MKQGDFVEIQYVGKVKETGKIFDVTDEVKAKQANVYKEGNKYEPIQVVVGAGHIIQGLDESLLNMEVGETKTFDIPPEKGFGKRDSSLLQLLPLNDFKKHGLFPRAGLKIEINGHWATVRSVSSGRVKLDFNHPLAGKTLQYEVTLSKKIDDLTEKINSILKVRAPGIDVSSQKVTIEEEKVNIELKGINPPFKSSLESFIKSDISNYIPEMKDISINFID
ncbi:MAG TPA: peptidylprolyl isomerase [Methanofastidiosum sp.]|nr:peptidylprolyl isomerase [Methanofastidiosum sp.]HPA49495.1 peptidylprolyl isomerase [Methanofastidiosum sp.]HQK62643.1 peptidylprolyl isomerase [Methanofastidiosum sp.]HQM94176.1 peptidylprolyl isomerase [Methanofastidiosum sp.]HQQ48796.1 peptidylprolyl isomerase [Methanofastidiosum sp.]